MPRKAVDGEVHYVYFPLIFLNEKSAFLLISFTVKGNILNCIYAASLTCLSYSFPCILPAFSHHREFLLVITFCLASFTLHFHISSPSTGSLCFLSSSSFFYFLFFLLPVHFPDVLPQCFSCLCSKEKQEQRATSQREFISRLCRDGGPIGAIRSSLKSSKNDRV